MSGSTVPWLKRALSLQEVRGGFVNRFIYVPGEIKPPIAFPPKPDESKLNDLMCKINQMRLWAEQKVSEGSGELNVPSSTKYVFELYYRDYHRRCASDTLSANLIARIQSYAFKLSLLFAATEFSGDIRPEHLERALIVADFLERSIVYVFDSFGDDPSREKEQLLIQFLQSRGAGLVPFRDVYTGLHWSVKEAERTIEPLERSNIVRWHSKKAANGKNQKFLELIY